MTRRERAQREKEATASDQEKRVAALEERMKTQLQVLSQSTGGRVGVVVMTRLGAERAAGPAARGGV